MNILQVAPYFPPYQGGQEKHVYNLSINLERQGHDVAVLTSDYPKGESSEGGEEIDVYRLPVLGRVLRNPITPPRKEVLSLFRWADIVHTHNEHALLSNIAALVGKYEATPLVLTCHGQLSFQNPVADRIEDIYTRTVGAVTLRAMDRVIALSKTDRQHLVSLGVDQDSIEIIPNGIDVPDRPTDRFVDQFQERHGIAGRRVVLFIGPMLPRKSPETVIRAMRRVRAEHPDAVAVMVGRGPSLDTVKTKAESMGLDDAVCFTGYLSANELAAAYESGEILAFPSISEGLPTTILEALAYELPVVATDLPPLRDWFEEYVVLVESDSARFAEAINHLLHNDYLIEKMGTGGSEFVRSRFTWETVSTEVVRLYREIVGKQATTPTP